MVFLTLQTVAIHPSHDVRKAQSQRRSRTSKKRVEFSHCDLRIAFIKRLKEVTSCCLPDKDRPHAKCPLWRNLALVSDGSMSDPLDPVLSEDPRREEEAVSNPRTARRPRPTVATRAVS
jgi:hypothetical protein